MSQAQSDYIRDVGIELYKNTVFPVSGSKLEVIGSKELYGETLGEGMMNLWRNRDYGAAKTNSLVENSVQQSLSG